MLLVGWQEEHPACKNMEWSGAGVVICLERSANDLHMVQVMPLPPCHLLLHQNPEWFILLVPAYTGCPGKKAIKRLCVCACPDYPIPWLSQTSQVSGNSIYGQPLMSLAKVKVDLTDDADGDAGFDVVTMAVVAKQRQQSVGAKATARLAHVVTGNRRRHFTVCLSTFHTRCIQKLPKNCPRQRLERPH